MLPLRSFITSYVLPSLKTTVLMISNTCICKSMSINVFAPIVEGIVMGRLELSSQPFPSAGFAESVQEWTSRASHSDVVGISN